MRFPVDRERIERFFVELGMRFHAPARVWLTGGASMVADGLKPRTEDIDIVYDVDAAVHGEFISAVRDLKEKLSISVEEAGPGDFIPLPPGHEARAVFVGTYGSIQVYAFDPYSTALSKVDRGTEKDFDDVVKLLAAERIDWERLQDYFDAILPEFGTRSLKQDPRGSLPISRS